MGDPARYGALILLAGCGFTPSGASATGDGGPADSRSVVDVAPVIDAPKATADAPIDGPPPFTARFNVAGPQLTGVDFPGVWAARSGAAEHEVDDDLHRIGDRDHAAAADLRNRGRRAVLAADLWHPDRDVRGPRVAVGHV